MKPVTTSLFYMVRCGGVCVCVCLCVSRLSFLSCFSVLSVPACIRHVVIFSFKFQSHRSFFRSILLCRFRVLFKILNTDISTNHMSVSTLHVHSTSVSIFVCRLYPVDYIVWSVVCIAWTVVFGQCTIVCGLRSFVCCVWS